VSGTFAGNQITATAMTNASGIATAPAFTANSTAGNYTLTASVAGAAAPANFVLTNAVPGPTSLGGLLGTKVGPKNARVWTVTTGNNGPGSALGTEITSFKLTQTLGAACTPVIETPFPLQAGNIAPKATASVTVTIDFTGCGTNAAFKLTATESANDGAATGTIVLGNQFQ
jgi:hypothetical protein